MQNSHKDGQKDDKFVMRIAITTAVGDCAVMLTAISISVKVSFLPLAPGLYWWLAQTARSSPSHKWTSDVLRSFKDGFPVYKFSMIEHG